jgi:hypothetical protein
MFSIRHVGQEHDKATNRLAQQASGYEVRRGTFSVLEELISCGAINTNELAVTRENDTTNEDWRVTLQRFIMDPGGTGDRKVLRQALKYIVLDGELYRRTINVVLLKCLSGEQIKVAMGEVHEGMCGTHQSAHKMKWMLKRAGFYWPTMVADCFKYFKRCEACQRFGDVQLVPTSMMRPVMKHWSFRCWGLDFIGEMHPSSSKGHRFVLVATDYFTKWTEAVPLRNMTHREVISCVLEHIIHRFGIPQTLTTNQGAAFMSQQFKAFVTSLRIKLVNSSPYYAQSNGQAEASNKILVKLIKKKIDEHPRRWHEVLSEALWAHRVSRHGATKTTPFELVYEQEAVLPMEFNLQACRVVRQNDLSAKEYTNLMMDRLDEAEESRFEAMTKIEKEKLQTAKAYNKKVSEKLFQIRDLVWRTILPLKA